MEIGFLFYGQVHRNANLFLKIPGEIAFVLSLVSKLNHIL